MSTVDDESGRDRGVDWGRVLRLALSVAAVGSTLFVLPAGLDFLWTEVRLFFPEWLRKTFEQSRWIWCGLAVAVPLQVAHARRSSSNRLLFLDRAGDWLLGRVLPATLAAAVALMAASWLPHYLTWPWWADVEHFALSALSWDAGIAPYRDLYDFNFPGPMYVHWGLGKAFGWGRTAPFYAFDAALLAGFVVAAVSWSRVRLGGSTPGLVASAVALSYYFNLNVPLVAQRDWQVPLLAASGLMALECLPGRFGRVVSAALFAAGFSFRPHVVVFVPAYLSAIDENARAAGGPFRPTLGALAEWGLIAGAGCGLAFLPLLVTGTLDDFLRTFREALSGGGYSESGKRVFVDDLLAQLQPWETWSTLTAVGLAALFARGPFRRTAVTWFLALVFVLFYLPLSPVAHGYLGHPLALVKALALGVTAAWLLGAAGPGPLVRLVLVAAILGEFVPEVPRYCLPSRSVEAAGLLWRGEGPSEAPPGCRREYSPSKSYPYQWKDYQSTLGYLRRNTGPRTLVANLCRDYPFPTFNAPVGRLTPFPSVAGVLWLRWVDPSLESEFAASIERAGDAVVVWTPSTRAGHPRLELPLILADVRRGYTPEAKFGAFEVWRRKPTDRTRAPDYETTEAPPQPGTTEP